MENEFSSLKDDWERLQLINHLLVSYKNTTCHQESHLSALGFCLKYKSIFLPLNGLIILTAEI